MEYVQERVTTLHDFADPNPDAPTGRTAVVVPMTERDHASLGAERVFARLETVSPARVVVALRAHESAVGDVAAWLDSFDLPVEVLWCNAPGVRDLLGEAGLNGRAGKGRDVWLALGVAASTAADYVVVHDADTKSYSTAHVPRLLFPLTLGHEFAKGYYARVEGDRLYGRLFRLFYVPLVRALSRRTATDTRVVEYLDSFRYALAGEFAATADLARRLRAPRDWGLEVGTLGDAFAVAGFEGSAQVDLGRHEHDHRAVGGPGGLSEMCEQVGAAVFRVVEEHGPAPDYAALAADYRESADRLVDQYAADAAFNGFEYDPAAEREQVAAYADAVRPPDGEGWLPAWADAPVDPESVRDRAREGVEAAGR